MPNIDDIYKSKYTGEEIDELLDKVQLQDFTYDSLKDKPIINQDLLIGGFTPQRNTYYRHTGRTASGFAKGIIYLYSGGKYTAIKGGSGGGGGGGYELPVATDTELGGIIVGNGLTITEDGVLSVVSPGGTVDYNSLSSKPITNQDLTASGFTPVANTYYRHTGATTEVYTQGAIYFYDGTAYSRLALSKDIPTRVSQLQNDAGYTTNKGTVISVRVNGTTYTADSNGLVDLGTISGGTTYRSIYNEIY